MRVLVTGSRGFAGTALVSALEADGHRVQRLVRGSATAGDDVRWDPMGGSIDSGALEGFDAVVHLAGEGIAERRWTEAQKRRVRESRVRGTTLLAQCLAGLRSPPAVLVSASAIGYYGDRGDEELTEESSPGDDFLARVCREWEAATAPAEQAGVRVAHFRSGIVQSPAGGSLKKQLPLFKAGLGGRLGSGRQYVSWISLDDEVGAIRHLLLDDGPSGPYNLTSPNPVTNAVFTATLAGLLRRPAVLPVPGLALELVLGRELAAALPLASQRVLPSRLAAAGYGFRHPHLEGALRDLLG